MANGFTPTQQRLLGVLSDGRAHLRAELLACFDDPSPTSRNLSFHLTNIRQKLRPIGQDIICQLLNRRIAYRRIRFFTSDD